MAPIFPSQISRRSLLSFATSVVALAGGTSLLAACGAAATGSGAATAASASAPAVATSAATTAQATTSAAPTLATSSVASVATASTAATSAAAATTAAAKATTSTQSNIKVAAAAGGTTVQWWNGYAKPASLASDLFAKQWTPTHPQIGIELIQHVGNNIKAEEQLTVLLAGGTPPDLCDVPMSENDLATHGLSQPIDDLVARDKYDLSQYNKGFMELAHANGKLYAIPYSTGGNGYVMVYNRNMLAQAGVAEPPASWDQAWTWNDFRDNVHKLTKGSGAQMTQAGLGDYGYYVLTIPIPWKTDWITPDLQTITADAPEMITAYSDYLDLVLKDGTTAASPGVKLDSSGSLGVFGAGQAAISMLGSWQMADLSKLTKVDWGFMPTPKGALSSPEFGPVFLALAKGAKHRDEAWQVLQWLVNGGRYAHFKGNPGATKADAGPILTSLFKGTPNARPQVLIDEYDIAQPLPYIRRHPAWGQMSTLTDKAWAQMSKGQVDVPTAMGSLKTALQGIVDQYKKSHPTG
jgi:maltose-binding protein MalE